MKLWLVLLICLPASLVAQPTITVATTGPGFCDSVGFGSPSTGFSGGDGSTTAASSSVAFYNLPNADGLSTCVVTVDTELDTLGPVEPGFLQVSLIGQVDTSGASFAAFMEFFVNGTLYDHCVLEGCGGLNLTIPLTLGVPFEITTVAGGWINSMDDSYFAVGGDGYVEATIQAYAATVSGTYRSNPSVLSQIIFASSALGVSTPSVPEPGTWLLVFPILGLRRVSTRLRH